MPLVDLDTILANSELDLLDDLAASCLDTQDLGRLHDVVSGGGPVINARDSHNLGQAVAFNGQVVSIIRVHLFGNDCALDARHSLNDNMR